jgi:type III secretion system low calcium response chaperone LcrH/SycD
MAAVHRERRSPGRDTDALEPFRAVVRDGGVLGDVLGMPKEGRDTLYAMAYDVYAKGQYERARKLFAQLALYDHQDPRYMKGLAATTQMLGDYEQALQMYAVVALMDATDPTPVMQAGDCLDAMGRHAEALESFGLARSMCAGPAHEQVRRRCERLLDASKQPAK